MEVIFLRLKELVGKIGLPRLVLLILAGVVLLYFSVPGGSEESGEKKTDHRITSEELALQAMEVYEKNKEEKLETILADVDGIGKVRVMLTLAASEERVPMQNGQVKEDEINEADQAGGKRKTETYESQTENVLIQREGEEEPYVVQIHAPAVEGIVVVAKGADSGEKKKEIIDAIQALFPVEAHKIKVMKMK